MTNSNKGRPLAEDHKQKISNSLKGNKNKLGTRHSEETKRKIGSAHVGLKHTEEVKQIIREKRANQIFSEETRKKMSLSHSGNKNHNYGKRMSNEQRNKISSSLKGQFAGEKHPFYGHTHTKEARLKISLANTGKLAGEKHHNYAGGRTEYCHKFRSGTFRDRVRAFFNNVCVLCGESAGENEVLDVHHVYYNKKACCEVSRDGKYYSDLGIKGHLKDFEIVGNPYKFVALHHKCHTKTTMVSTRYEYARLFEKIINADYNGKSYLTKEEYRDITET